MPTVLEGQPDSLCNWQAGSHALLELNSVSSSKLSGLAGPMNLRSCASIQGNCKQGPSATISHTCPMQACLHVVHAQFELNALAPYTLPSTLNPKPLYVYVIHAQAEFNALAGQLAAQYPDRARLWFAYDEPLSHLFYAGSDLFLVPSMFEPCGLTQMIAMRYAFALFVQLFVLFWC